VLLHVIIVNDGVIVTSETTLSRTAPGKDRPTAIFCRITLEN